MKRLQIDISENDLDGSDFVTWLNFISEDINRGCLSGVGWDISEVYDDE